MVKRATAEGLQVTSRLKVFPATDEFLARALEATTKVQRAALGRAPGAVIISTV